MYLDQLLVVIHIKSFLDLIQISVFYDDYYLDIHNKFVMLRHHVILNH